MREIKFRAWWKTQSVMAPVYDLKYDFYNPQENMPSTKTLILKTLSIDTHSTYPYKDFLNHGKIGWNNPNMMIDVEECYIMQYTGLEDKNGVEIYEGDIVKATIYGGDSLTGKVWWDQWQCGFMMIDKPMSRYMRDDDDTIFIEVLGNIYETPELLTTKEN